MKKPQKGLIGKSVITKEGNTLGEISKSIIDDKTGKIESITIKPITEATIIQNKPLQQYELTYPASCFTSVKDIIVLEEPEKPKRKKDK